MALALLQDMSKCTACRACQVACKEWNELPAAETSNSGSYENPPSLSPTTWTRVQFLEEETKGEPRWRFFKTQCMHCTNAPCVEVCPTAALRRHPLGFVSLERDRCNGCGYCAKFCPFGVPQLDVSSRWTGRAKVAKCTLCEDRVTSGGMPACAKACPPGAIQFGDRNALVMRGKARVAELRNAGQQDATLYGETELGGLGVLYVLPEAPSRYPALPTAPDRVWRWASTWQHVLQPLGTGVLLYGIAGLVFNYFAVSLLRPRGGDDEPPRERDQGGQS